MFEHLPGGDLLEAGLRDLRAGRITEAALLVLVGRRRLVRCGIMVPSLDPPPALPEHALYDLLVDAHGREDGYRRYNSLMRRLVSLENALDVVGQAT